MSDATYNQPRLLPSHRLISACLLLVFFAVILPLRPAAPLDLARVQPQLLQLASSQPAALVRVIVQQARPQPGIAKLVAQLGGTLTHDLPLIKGFAAQLPARAIAELARLDSVRYVSLDAPMAPAGALERPAGQAVAGNLLANAGFEYDWASWENWGNAAAVADAHTGAKAMRIGTGAGGLGQIAAALPGQQFALSAWAKSTGPAANVGFKFLDASFNAIGGDIKQTVGASAYTQYSLVGTAPAATAYVQAWAWADASAGYLWVDDFLLTRTLDPSAPATTCAGNLAINPGFELGLTGWQTDGSASLASEPYTGAKAGRLGASTGGLHQPIRATEGEQFKLTLAAKSTEQAAWFATGLAFFDAAWNELGDTSQPIRSSSYASYSFFGVAPPNTAFVQPYAWAENGSGSIWVDDLCLTRSSEQFVDAGTNYLPNPGFEAGQTGWKTYGSVASVADAHSGTKAIQIGAAHSGVERAFGALPGQQFTLSAWAKTNESAWQGLAIRFLDASNQLVGQELQVRVSSATYKKYVISGTAPAGTAQVIVSLWKDPGSGYVWLDDLYLATPTTPSAAQLVCSNDLLSNGGFEYGLAGWDMWGGNSTTSADAHSGSRALRVTAKTGFGPTDSLRAEPGQHFNLSFWAKASDASIGASMGLQFLDASNNVLTTRSATITSETYGLYSLSATAPAGTASVYGYFWKDTDVGSALVDDICLSLVANPATSATPACSTNLAQNPGFESGLVSWNTWNSPAVVADAHSGAKAIAIGTAAGGISQRIAAAGNQQFVLTAWGKSMDPRAGLGLSFFGPTGAQIGMDTYATIASSVYAPTTVSATAPDGAAFVDIWAGKDSLTGTVAVDDICLTSSNALRPPENPSNLVSGLTYQYYEGSWSALPDFDTLTPLKTGAAPNITLEPRDQADSFAFAFSGYINIPADGSYTFYTTSDDGSELFIGNTLVVANDGLHAAQERSGSIRLQAGRHAFRVEYFEAGGAGEQLTVQYAGPNIAKQPIPSGGLYRGTDALGGGGINREYWLNVAGAGVANIPLASAPSGVDILTKLEGPLNWNDNYGARFRGYVIPPTTGSYTFWVAGDDNTELWLSTDAKPANKVRIGYVAGWTASRAWDANATQKSAALTLVAGRRYYIEVLHKESGGGDNVAVAWQGAGIATRDVIAGQYLLPYLATSSTPTTISTANLKNVFNLAVRAPELWNAGPRYLQGQGMTALVIDSGIMPNADLGARYLGSLNFVKGEQQGSDRYGHGTFVANMIASDGSKSGGQYIGIAPRANVLSFRVNNNQGQGTESDVVAALQWAFENRQVHNIRVVNISLNSSMATSYANSPLCAAVEMLWFSGITVVVAAGNNGSATLYPPANDPFVITVGAADDKGTPGIADDTVASFSAWGTAESGLTKPELVAPGRNIVAYLPVTSDLSMSVNRPGNRIGADYFRMSGTSVAAPIVSGAALLLLQDEPRLTPDQVKLRLTTTAVRGDRWAGYDPAKAGAGYLDIYAAVNGSSTNAFPTLIRPSPALQSVFGTLWTSTNWQATTAGEVNWNSVNWNSVNWNSVNWNSVNWNSVNWNSVNWNSVNWNSVNWNSVNWNSDYWE